VKWRQLPAALGIRRAPREYSTEVVDFPLAEGSVRFARWLHPGEREKSITQPAVDALRAFLRPGDVAIDIGAHTGDSTLPIALAVGATGTVFALEPNPHVFKVLALNASLNPQSTRIVPLMFAAAAVDGTGEFTYSDEGYCNGGLHDAISPWKHGHFFRLRVQTRNLLAYLRQHEPDVLPKVRFIKIDTEGFDRTVAASLADLLRSARPFVKTEIYKHLPASERAAYYGDLRALGYRLFKCGDSDYRGEEIIDAAGLSAWPHFDVFAIPEEMA
jgi:FkbM family methyltransferase